MASATPAAQVMQKNDERLAVAGENGIDNEEAGDCGGGGRLAGGGPRSEKGAKNRRRPIAE